MVMTHFNMKEMKIIFIMENAHISSLQDKLPKPTSLFNL